MPSYPSPAKLPSIPTPVRGNLDSIHETLMAVKHATEQLMGTRNDHPVTRTFIQETTPFAYVTGDQWVQPSTAHISYWEGKAWRLTKGA